LTKNALFHFNSSFVCIGADNDQVKEVARHSHEINEEKMDREILKSVA
jgi:hypothetical protein